MRRQNLQKLSWPQTVQNSRGFKQYCIVCDNLFDKLNDDLYKKIDDKINQLGVEFDTFLVGSKISKDIQKRDEELSEKFDLNVETIKKEVNRLIGLGIWEIYGKEAEFESRIRKPGHCL